jgi:formylglycine-generating enzyme required for sulfatase activity
MGDSPFGVSDMVGNVREWVTFAVEPDGGPRFPLRGGGRDPIGEKSLECSYQEELWDGAGKATIGFRIAVADQER